MPNDLAKQRNDTAYHAYQANGSHLISFQIQVNPKKKQIDGQQNSEQYVDEKNHFSPRN